MGGALVSEKNKEEAHGDSHAFSTGSILFELECEDDFATELVTSSTSTESGLDIFQAVEDHGWVTQTHVV